MFFPQLVLLKKQKENKKKKTVDALSDKIIAAIQKPNSKKKLEFKDLVEFIKTTLKEDEEPYHSKLPDALRYVAAYKGKTLNAFIDGHKSRWKMAQKGSFFKLEYPKLSQAALVIALSYVAECLEDNHNRENNHNREEKHNELQDHNIALQKTISMLMKR